MRQPTQRALLLALLLLPFGSLAEMEEERSYFLGYSFGYMLKESGNEDVDLDALLDGMRRSLENEPPELSDEDQAAIQALLQERQDAALRQRAEAENQLSKENRMAGEEFLAENAKQDGVQVQDSGLQFLVLEEGEGERPEADDTVVVHYEGRLIDGTVFDASRQRGRPAEFGLRQVIPGWTEGLQLMRVGSKYRLFVPSDLGYGQEGAPGIPSNSTLIFDVELLEIK